MTGQLGAGIGLGGSVFANGYPGAVYAGGAPTALPEGPATITQRGFGVPSPGAGGSKGLTCAAIGTGALIVLGFIWWTLPR